MTDDLAGATTTHRYDGLHRLVAADTPGEAVPDYLYSYDERPNVTAVTAPGRAGRAVLRPR